jgi:hypothetical protein
MALELLIHGELDKRGIERQYFNKFYYSLTENRKVPSPDEEPHNNSWQLYKNCVDYLRDEQVLDEKNRIEQANNKNFGRQYGLELMQIATIDTKTKRRQPSGGMLPCSYKRERKSNGGMLPCTYDDE